MNPNRKYSTSHNLMRWLLVVEGVFLLYAARTAFGQETPLRKAGITNIEATPIISLRIDISASGKQVVIPACGDYGEDGYAFCYGDAFMEVYRRGSWVRANFRKGLSATMGSSLDEVRKPILIASGNAAHFIYIFSKEDFGIQTNEHLRFKVNAWDSPDSIDSRNPKTTFISAIFECP